MTLAVIPADYGDAAHGAALLGLLDIYARDPMGGGSALPDHTRANLLAGLAATPSALSLLAYADDQPVGLANCFWGFSTFAARPLLNIHDVVTHPEYRGRGVAAALFAEIERRARERGCCKITLEVLSGNHRARSLYSRLGYSGYALDPAQGTAEFWQKALT